MWGVTCFARLRGIKMGSPAIRNRWRIGEIPRRNATAVARNLGSRRTNHFLPNMKVFGDHRVGGNRNYHGVPFPLFCCVRVVYIDVREVRWCSVGSVAFHSFAWPTFDVRTANSIVCTIWTDHRGWANVLVVRGRCWRSHGDYFRSNRVLEDLLRRWCGMGRPFVVYKAGDGETGGGHPIPAWLGKHVCVCGVLCVCNLVGVGVSGRFRAISGQGWHHFGMLCANRGAVWF